MDTYLKLTSVKNNKNCNCITPFYVKNIKGINPITQREYSSEDIDAMKTSLYRISAAKSCEVSVCCDINDPATNVDSNFTKQFIQRFPKIMPLYEGSSITSFKLSTTETVKTSGWIDPTPYMICKITKATIKDTSDPTIKLATNLVKDCYSNNCGSLETITVNTLLQNAKADMNYTYFDDARVSQAILENNITYVKEYIRKYKQVNIPLTNDDYNNRLIHIAAGSNYNEILTMLIALKTNLNITNKYRETPIQFAIRSKNIDNISSLLTQGVDLNMANNNGETAMFYAMKTGDLRIINMLYTNNSPIQGVDKNGNNLIHYCILNCPSYKEDDDSIPNTKGEIIQFLIEHGISTEQKNNAGITPLELVSKQINKEINIECAISEKTDKDNVIEAFFPKYTTTTNTNTNTDTNTQKIQHTPMQQLKQQKKSEHFSDSINMQDISDYTTEHVSLLDIQSKLFNNILRNNPTKYGDYISVDDIPIGAPIEVLDTVCVNNSGMNSNMLTGNEDSEECISKGGQLVKIKNKTTKIKLELMPEEDSKIALINQDELYYPKDTNKIPKGTISNNISSYNASVKNMKNNHILSNNETQSTSITYTLGQESNNTIPTKQPNNNNTTVQLQQDTTTAIATATANTNIPKHTMHPSIIEEDDEIVHKCKKDAINNAVKMSKHTDNITSNKIILDEPQPTINVQPTINIQQSLYTFSNKYKTQIFLLCIIILCLLGYIIFFS